MKPTFKEVAHLYIGCQMNNGTTLYSVDADGEWMLLDNTHKGCSNFRPEWDESVKPLLRKISDITEEENEGWNKIGTTIGEMYIESAQQIHWAKRLNYYRSLQMDCDNLIDNGYAVERTGGEGKLKRNFDWIKEGRTAWTQGWVGLPVRVQIKSVNKSYKTAIVNTGNQEGDLSWERLFETEAQCPCR